MAVLPIISCYKYPRPCPRHGSGVAPISQDEAAMSVWWIVLLACYAALIKCTPLTETRLQEPNYQAPLDHDGQASNSKVTAHGFAPSASAPKLERRASNPTGPLREDFPAPLLRSLEWQLGEAAGKCICEKELFVCDVQDGFAESSFVESSSQHTFSASVTLTPRH